MQKTFKDDNKSSNKQFILLLTAFALILSLAIISVQEFVFGTTKQEAAIESIQHEFKDKQLYFQDFIEHSEGLLYSVRHSKWFQNYLKSHQEKGKTEEVFLSIVQSNQYIYQFRYIDANGKEQIRVDRDKEINSVHLIAEERLQDKANRYYFADSKSKPLETTWFSALDLNIENGKVEEPFVPTFRGIYPIKENGEFAGILIVNYFMQSFVGKLVRSELYDAVLFDDRGYTMYHYLDIIGDNSKSWGNTLNHHYNIAQDFSEAKEILDKHTLESKIYVKQRLDVPVSGGIHLLLKIKEKFLQEYAFETKMHFLSICLVVVGLLILLFSAVKLFRNQLFYVSKLKKLLEEIKITSVAFEGEVGIVITDTNGVIQKVNKSYCKINGYSETELLGKTPKILQSGIHDKVFYKNMWKDIKGQGHYKGVVINQRKDGSRYPSKIIITSITDENLNPKYYVAFLDDITEKVAQEQQILEQKKAAEELKQLADQANQAKSEFLANMSHEIRTPLNGIIGLTDLVLETPINSEQKDYLGRIKNSSMSLLTIINDILDFSKIEAGKLSIEKKEFILGELLNYISNLFSFQIHGKGLEFHYIIDPDIPHFVYGDSLRLAQVLSNLLGNSIKFTTEGTIFLKVHVKNKSDSRVEIEFILEDTGIGIAEEQQKNLFQAFMQADNSITRKYGGTGLGLMISKQLVELMGGTIELESTYGQGSKFFFTIPFEYYEMNDSKAVQHFASSKFLVVEDNDIDREYLCNILRSWNIIPVEAKDGTEALKILEDESFEYLLLDWMMPNIDGLALLEILEEKNIKVPYILISTAYAKKDLLRIAKDKNISVEKVLEKPYVPSALLDMLSNMNIFYKKEFEVNVESIRLRDPKKALLVEDNETNQIIASNLLEEYGFEVEVADNGAEALIKINENSFDIIYMDLHMPVMDGFEASRRIREFNEEIPIVAFSAAAMDKDKELSSEAGMDEHISKPINKHEFEKVIQKYFPIIFENNGSIMQEENSTEAGDLVSLEGVDIQSVYRELGTDIDTLYKLYVNFEKEYEQNITMLDIDVSSKRFKEYIHKLKSVSGNLKINNVFNLARKIHDETFSNEDIQQLQDEMIKVCYEIHTKITPLVGGTAVLSTDELKQYIEEFIQDLKEFNHVSQERLNILFSSLKACSLDLEELKQALKEDDDEKSIEILTEIGNKLENRNKV